MLSLALSAYEHKKTRAANTCLNKKTTWLLYHRKGELSMERRKPRLKIQFFKRMWRKYGFPRIRRTRKYQKLRMKVMGYE